MKAKKLFYNLLPIIVVILIIGIWWIQALIVDESLILPTPIETLKSFFALFLEAEFYSSFLQTLFRALIAFIISFVLAIILAYLSKEFKWFKKAISPIISILRALPTIAVVLLLLIWTTKKIAPLIVTSIVVLPILYSAILDTFNQIDNDLIEMCKLYKVKRSKILLKVQVPIILPSLLTNIGTGISLNVKLMVAAEVLASTANSLGHMMNIAKNLYYDTPRLLALMVITIIVGIVFEFAFNLIAKKVGKWK